MKVASDVVTFRNQLMHLLYCIHDEPRANAVLRIGHAVFKDVNRLAELRRPLDCLPQCLRVSLAVGSVASAVPLGYVRRDEQTGIRE